MDAKSVRSTERLTRSLLSVVGSPFEPQRDMRIDEDLSSLYRYAINNRMALLTLDALNKRGINVFRDDYEKLGNNYLQAMDLMVRVSDLLEEAGIDFVFFKSLRPYREATVDIDVLVFGSSYRDVLKAVGEAGYFLLERGPLSATFRDPVSKLGIDIHEEIAVSHLIYLDKEKLDKQVVRREVPGGGIVRTLSPAADLLAIICHSVLKEQMYVLSEYYSTLFYLYANKDGAVLRSLASLAEECNLDFVIETHLGMTASLHKEFHGFIPNCIQQTYGRQDGSWEFSRVSRLGLGFPAKYHPLTVVKALSSLLKERKGKRGIAVQTSKMLDPRFCLRLSTHLIQHMMRQAY